jgi:hypothetical protein
MFLFCRRSNVCKDFSRVLLEFVLRNSYLLLFFLKHATVIFHDGFRRGQLRLPAFAFDAPYATRHVLVRCGVFSPWLGTFMIRCGSSNKITNTHYQPMLEDL